MGGGALPYAFGYIPGGLCITYLPSGARGATKRWNVLVVLFGLKKGKKIHAENSACYKTIQLDFFPWKSFKVTK